MTAQPPETPPGPPPGWYPDPAGLRVLRWWDGTRWGPQTQSLPPQEPAAQGTQPGGPQAATVPPAAMPLRRRRTVVKAVAGVIAAAVVLLVIDLVASHIGSSAGSGSSSNCSTGSCATSEIQRSLVGLEAKDGAAITKASCKAATENSGGTWTASCQVTESDGAVSEGTGNWFTNTNQISYEPLTIITPPSS